MTHPKKLSLAKDVDVESECVPQEVLAVSPSNAAQMLGISPAQLWKLHSAGKVPSPIYLSRKTPRWRVEELGAWVNAGCPERSAWQKRKSDRAQ